MKLVVGLGNPGPRYAASRHNVGFLVVDSLARSLGLALDEERFGGLWAEGHLPPGPEAAPDAPAEPLGLLKPLTFMNRSGESVAAALAALPACDPGTDLAVVYDDLDLPFGRLRVRPSGGAGGHRGMESLIESLDTRAFARVRFGIGRPEADERARSQVVDFVLEDFSADEERVLADRIPTAAEAVAAVLREGAVRAMDRFNAAPEPAPDP